AYLDEVYEETVRAFNLAEAYRMPVYLLIDEVIGHLSERVEIPPDESLQIVDRTPPSVPPEEYLPYDSSKSDVPPMASYFSGYRFHMTGLNHDSSGFPTTTQAICHAENVRMMRKVTANLSKIEKFEEYLTEDAKIGVVAFGSTARAAVVSVSDARQNGIQAGLFRPITLWPFPEEAVRQLASHCRTIIVAEANLGQLIYEVERVVRGECEVVGVQKVGGVPIYPAEILDKIIAVNSSWRND
ncbi:MAG: 2-oxoacid:acceptor oxidoreductase subunit alpha, partial [Calditrichaeota bacterium]|nr:2-oxoacid:acceptor oxidoreductase subunit alpha [Calditrichota bacterium]